MKDLRDPGSVGEALLRARRLRTGLHTLCSTTADRCAEMLQVVPDYASDLGPLEKYGDPTTLPSTMP